MEAENLSNNTNSLNSESENLCVSLPLAGKREDSLLLSQLDNSGTTDHTLEEYTFDIELPKSCLDSYAHKDENPNKKFKIKNYSVTSADYCKNLVSKIEKEVICNSESTSEAKIINMQEELNYIKKEKAKINSIINDKTELAIENYSKLLIEIDRLFLIIKDHFIQDPIVDDIINEKKLIMSNLALAYTKIRRWKESIDIDEEILKSDSKFIKSYARLIRSHVSLENYHQAQGFATQMRSNFNKEVIAQYADILEDFDLRNQAFEEKSLKNLARKNKKKEEEEKSKKAEQAEVKKTEAILDNVHKKVQDEDNVSQVAKRQKNWFGAIFGGLMFLSSSAGLFLLYKYRKHFSL